MQFAVPKAKGAGAAGDATTMDNSSSFESLTPKPSGLRRFTGYLLEQLLDRSERMLALTFGLLILIGAYLLWLPAAQKHNDVRFIDALFTSTSAVCVTGLTTVDTEKDYTRFGQAVILVLFQFGGFGIMTFAALGSQMLGRRMSFRSQYMLGDTFFQKHAASSVGRDLKRIFALTFFIEAAGALIIYFDLIDEPNETSPIFSAIFHSVSAFCNAGFSIYSDNLSAHHINYYFTYAIMVLIILGGLGHAVVLETSRRLWCRLLRRRVDPYKWSLNTRVVLLVSALLIFFGAVTIGPLGAWKQSTGWFDGFTNSLFQSITCRTAGFNTVDIGSLSRTALLVMMVLMFIGGSPASCAGGVKTTSVATWGAQLLAWLRGRADVTLLGRRLPPEVVARAAMIIGLGVLWCCFGCMLLATLEPDTEKMNELNLMFEQVSAFGTVGLSTGITPLLTFGSKVWIILSMFVGRIGPLTFAMIVSQRTVGSIRYPEERLMVG